MDYIYKLNALALGQYFHIIKCVDRVTNAADATGNSVQYAMDLIDKQTKLNDNIIMLELYD